MKKLSYLWNRYQSVLLSFSSAVVALIALTLAIAGAISWTSLAGVGVGLVILWIVSFLWKPKK